MPKNPMADAHKLITHGTPINHLNNLGAALICAVLTFLFYLRF